MNEMDELCQELKAQLPDYLDGELESQVCAEIERHIQGCDNCRIMVDTLRKTITLYRDHGSAEVPSDVHERLTHILDLERLKTKSRE